MSGVDVAGTSIETARKVAAQCADGASRACVLGRLRTKPQARRFTYTVRFDLGMEARLVEGGAFWEPIELVSPIPSGPAAFRVERRALVVEILRRAGVPVIRPGALTSGISVSANGLQVRVATVGDCTSRMFEAIRKQLATAAQVLRAGGIDVLEDTNGIALTIGMTNASTAPVEAARCS